jgi:hypothetical protein
MAHVEAKLQELGVALPAPLILPSGMHAHSAVGMAELPFGIPVEIEAEVAIDA